MYPHFLLATGFWFVKIACTVSVCCRQDFIRLGRNNIGCSGLKKVSAAIGSYEAYILSDTPIFIIVRLKAEFYFVWLPCCVTFNEKVVYHFKICFHINFWTM
jgi:hypothetical protein